MQGEFCPAHAVRGGVLGEFCTGSWAVRLVLGEICFAVAPSACAVAGFPPPTGAPSWPSRPCSALDTGSGGGFAPCEALWRRVAGVSHPCMAQFPPLGSGAAVVCSGVAPKSQTTSVKNTENGLLVAKWSALWAQRCLAWCACSHANPLLRVLTRSIARKPAIESVSGAAQDRISGLTCA